MNESAPAKNVFREKEWWILAAVVLFLFRHPLLDATFFFRDLHFLHFTKKRMLLAALHAGELPLWDPLSQGGQPFLGDPQSTVFYPSNLLYLVFAPLSAFNISIVLQYLLCAFGAFWLARVLRLSSAAAFAAGAVFALCGYTLSTANLLLPLFGIAWLPILLGSGERFLETRRSRWAIAAIFAGAMPIFGGAPEVALMAYVTAGLWLLLPRRDDANQPRSGRFRLAFLLVLFAGIIGIALVQILPTIEMIRESTRGQGMPIVDFGGWSVNPRRLPELVVPEFLGPTNLLSESGYWGREIEDEGFPYILSVYFGFPALLLALFGAFSGSTPLPRQTRILLAVLIGGGFLFAIGRNEPLFGLVHHLPLVTVFRYPVKAIALTALPVAILAAAGLDGLRGGMRSKGLLALAWASAVAASLAALATLMSSSFTRGMQEFFFHAASERTGGFLATKLLHAAIVAIACAILVSLAGTKWIRVVPAALAVLIAADLAIAGAPVNDYAPRDFFDQAPAAAIVQSAIGDGRLYRTPNPAEFALKAPDDDIVWFSRWNLEILTDYTALLYGIPLVFHQDYGALGPHRTVKLGSIVNSVPWARRFPILAAAGCRAAMTSDLLRSRKPAIVVANASNRPFYIYPVEGRLAWFSSNVEIAVDSQVLECMGATSGGLPLFLAPPARPVTPCGDAAVTVASRSRNRIRVRVDAPCDGYVSLAQSFYPGWNASVDGRSARIERANYAFSAVYVDKGAHEIDFEYRPASVLAGATGTGTTILVLVAGIAVAKRREAQASRAASAISSNESTTSV